MAIFDIEENIDNIDSNILKDKMSQQIKLINGGRKSGTKLIFDPFNEYDGYNPLVINEFEDNPLSIQQIFIPNNIEVLDYIINLFETTTPSEMNFIDSEWCPKYDPIDTIKYYIDDPFFDEDLVGLSWYSLIGLGCGLTYKSKYTESLYIDPISKLKNSEYIEFDNESGCGEFTIYFSPRYKLPVLEINWDSGSYIGLNYDAYAPTSDVCTLIGEVEVATFYQILKIYKQFIDSI